MRKISVFPQTQAAKAAGMRSRFRQPHDRIYHTGRQKNPVKPGTSPLILFYYNIFILFSVDKILFNAISTPVEIRLILG